MTGERLVFIGVVECNGADASTTLHVQQSDAAGGNWVDTGFDIVTDGSGHGRVVIPNTSSATLLCGHQVRLVDGSGNVKCGPVTIVNPSWWWPSSWILCMATGTGYALASVTQNPWAEGAPMTTFDSYGTGSIIVFKLDPAEATWTVTGTPAVSCPQGNLALAIGPITSQEIFVQVLSNFHPDAPSSIVITGMGVTLNAYIPSLHPLIGIQGSVLTYEGGSVINVSSYPTTTFVGATIISLPSPCSSIPALSDWGLILLGLLLMAGGVVYLMRRGVWKISA